MTADVRTQPYRLYRFYDHAGRLLYIGQTGRMALVRAIEHLMEQAWASDVARWEVDPGEWWTETDVLAAEAAAIRAEKPIRNWVGNEGPHRQWLPKVREYRHPSPRHRAVPQPRGEHRARPSRLTARQVRLRNTAAVWVSLWLAVTLLAAYGLNRAVDQSWLLDLRAAALAGLLPAPLWHMWQGRNRRIRLANRWVAAALAAAALWSLATPLGIVTS